MQLARHCTAAILACLAAAASLAAPTLTAQAPSPQPVEGESEFLVIIGGRAVGREQVRMTRTSGNWVVTSSGTYGSPVNLTIRRFETTYTPDWQPVELHLGITQGTRTLELNTSFSVTSAINEITQNGVTNAKTDQISARAIVLPNNVYAGYEVLAARLASATPGTEIPVYVAPQGEVRVAVKAVTPEQIQTPSGPVPTRRYDLSYLNPGGAVDAAVTIDDKARFVRLEIPNTSLLVTRADLSTVATRTETTRNQTDADVTIPAAGFVLGGTITTPPSAAGTLRHPAVVIVGGTPQTGRDGRIAGIPIFAQLAGALAAEGAVVLRYDKRGVGQSGGRIENATLQDYADDLAGAVKWLSKRKDVDPKRLTVIGHGDGGSVAMLAAAKEKRIASLVLIATPGTTGAELVLEQQRHALDSINAPAAERQAKIDLQTRIHTAVTTDRGWESVPPELRRQADTPWFRSLLLFDPVKTMPKVKQPILILQGDLDKQVAPHHADKLADVARARKKAPAVAVKHFPGVNHLLVPATTGETSEYSTLPDKTIVPAVASAIAEWLRR